MVTAPFAYLPAGSSPLVFSLATPCQRGLLSCLGACGIRALGLRPVPRIPTAARAAVAA